MLVARTGQGLGVSARLLTQQLRQANHPAVAVVHHRHNATPKTGAHIPQSQKVDLNKGVAGAGRPPSLLAVAKRNLHRTENTLDQSRQDVSVTSPKYMLHLAKYLTCFVSL